MKEAKFYRKNEDGSVTCDLCRRHCLIPKNSKGHCAVRFNIDGKLHTLVYQNAVAESVDPIEKKPMYHFLPGSMSYSIATVGCNFDCLHCQNYHISTYPRTHRVIPGEVLAAELVVERALKTGCKSIAYTYTEPTVFYEYAFDVASLAAEKGLKNVFVTNGYTCDVPLEEISLVLDAANVDLKGFSDEFYKKVAGVSLQGVLQTIRKYHELGIWLEITTLLIPGYNDDEKQISGIANFIKKELGSSTPWHISAFCPTYKLQDVPRTPAETILKARNIGRETGLEYVYSGNIADYTGSNTYCPGCQKTVLERSGYSISKSNIIDGKCGFCSTEISGVFE